MLVGTGLPSASALQGGISERVSAQKGEQGWGRVYTGLDPSCPALCLPVMAAAASKEVGEGVVREM